MSSIFTKIVNGEIPCYKIAEDDHHLAFLDAFPLCEGHVLVIPKKEVDYIFDLESNELGALMVFAQGVARKMDKVLECKRIGVTVIGLEVPHTHVHLVPINSVGDMNFEKEKISVDKDRMQEIAEMIKNA